MIEFILPAQRIYSKPINQVIENLKKVQAKKNLLKANKSISRKKIFTKFHFLQFQKWPKVNF